MIYNKLKNELHLLVYKEEISPYQTMHTQVRFLLTSHSEPLKKLMLIGFMYLQYWF